MNEELQSTNEELQTLNDELRDRTLEVDRVNGFLQSILAGLELAVVVVDTDYRVQLWNGGAERLTGLRSFEAEGRRLLELDDRPAHPAGARRPAAGGHRRGGADPRRGRAARPLRPAAAPAADRHPAAAGAGPGARRGRDAVRHLAPRGLRPAPADAPAQGAAAAAAGRAPRWGPRPGHTAGSAPRDRRTTCTSSAGSTPPSWPWRPQPSTATSAASASSTRRRRPSR